MPPSTKQQRLRYAAGISPPHEAFTAASWAEDTDELWRHNAELLPAMIESTREQADAGAEIIVWSEYAFLSTADRLPHDVAEVAQLATEERIHIQVAVVLIADGRTAGNRAILIAPDGTIVWDYAKQHPVPGSEQFAGGADPVPVTDTDHGRLAAAICFDSDFPFTIAHAGRADADILLLPVLDWPGIEILHQQSATFRSVENGFSTVRQASLGRATVIDPHGRLLAAVDSRSVGQQVMVADVPDTGAPTLAPYLQGGFVVACALLLVALGILGYRPASRRPAGVTGRHPADRS